VFDYFSYDAPVESLTLAESTCLALVAEHESGVHGWHLVRALAPDGEVGRTWSLSRPLTYRALDRLEGQGLITRDRSSRRHLMRVTAEGRRTLDTFLETPVDHIRDLRTAFLVKCELRRRVGLDIGDLARRQLDHLDTRLDSLIEIDPGDDIVLAWRSTSASATREFLRSLGSS
jgi:DNA-binding MarR family transcriptional regulator